MNKQNLIEQFNDAQYLNTTDPYASLLEDPNRNKRTFEDFGFKKFDNPLEPEVGDLEATHRTVSEIPSEEDSEYDVYMGEPEIDHNATVDLSSLGMDMDVEPEDTFDYGIGGYTVPQEGPTEMFELPGFHDDANHFSGDEAGVEGHTILPEDL